MAHKQYPFLSKSPEARAADVCPAEAFPYMSCPWDPVQGTFCLTVRYYESQTVVKAILASQLMIVGIGLLGLWSQAPSST